MKPHRRILSPENNLTFLFVSLSLLIFVIYPFFDPEGTGSWIIQAFSLFVLISGSYAAVDRPMAFYGSLALAALALMTRATYLITPGLPMFAAMTSIWLVFILYTAAVVLARVLGPGRITLHRIKGAFAVYLLIGLAFAMAYGLLEVLSPGAFDQGEETAADGSLEGLVGAMVYLSFVTMTTLGYGDVTPVSAAARSLTTLEALVGQFYIAVLVARLVAMEMAQAGGEKT